jgi:hypothetical protein
MKIGIVGYASPGHLNTTTAIARRLQSRGHEAVFIGVPDTPPFVRAAGLTFVPYGPALINLRTYRRGVSRWIEMSVFSDRFTETVPLAGKTRSYREQIDRFTESVSFRRSHATERDSL